MLRYHKQTRILVAVDCIIFGFDGKELKLLLVKRSIEPEQGNWSLMGGFVQMNEDADSAAKRVLKQLTGLEGVYLEQLQTFSNPVRDTVERTISIAYFALIDIFKYQKQISEEYQPEWFSTAEIPTLIFDHTEMVSKAKSKLQYKAAFHPILFELLPTKFTLQQLQILYEAIYETNFDKRNFTRKIQASKLLIKQKDKERESSKKGAFYYKLDKKKYNANFESFLNFVPNPNNPK